MTHDSAPAGAAGGERSKVVSLWHERARRLGLSERLRPDFSALSYRALSELTEQHRALYAHAMPVMELLHQQILNTQSMVLLTDQRGLIMHALGDADFLQRAERVALKPGVLWSEDSKGTNAIGTALTEQRATLVHGSEHFLTVNRFLTCSCCPIRGPHGELIGALDVSGPQEGYHPHTMALVRMSTHLIEKHLFVDRFSRALRIHFHAHREWLGTLLEGVMAFDPQGRLLAANPSALAQLKLDPSALGEHGLRSLFNVEAGALLDRRNYGSIMRLNLPDGTALAARVESPEVPLRSAPGVSPPPGATLQPVAARVGPTLDELDTGDPAVAAAIAQVRRVRGHDIPILICGETGTGKELLARAIHGESARADKPFVAVDCASLPEPLIESELFGYAEGAFTGARRRGNPGKIVLADGGTLFLDEIGDMPLALQTRLLRVLQERVVRPLGAGRERSVDVEVICATHRDLKDMMRRGAFRQDLYYRLNGLVVRLPALRERQDLEALMAKILHAQPLAAPRFTPDVLDALRRYSWPGNIRQLANVLRTASIMAGEGGVVGPAQLPDDFLEEIRPELARPAPTPCGAATAPHADLKSLRADAVAAALQRNGGNISATARALGVSRNTIYRAIRASRST